MKFWAAIAIITQRNSISHLSLLWQPGIINFLYTYITQSTKHTTKTCCTQCPRLGTRLTSVTTVTYRYSLKRTVTVLCFSTPLSFLTSNVHISIPLNGIIRITSSIHFVVSYFSPFNVPQNSRLSITLDKRFDYKFWFNSVRNKINDLMKISWNSFLKNLFCIL